ncbi:MAG: heliorhodopsin HeR [Actinomycetota bacterium]
MSETMPINPVADGDPETVEVSDERLSSLRRWNIAAGVLHLVSAVAMTVIAADFTLPITTFNLNGPPGTPVEQGVFSTLVDVQLGPLTAAFLYLSALFHFIIATVGYRFYGSELRHGRNRFRWVEYSLSSTLMIVIIALVTTVGDFGALVGIAFANVAMILFGWIMEMVNRTGVATWWTPFWMGCIAGIGPWIAIVGYIFTGDGRPPGFVYGIIVTIFVLFNTFAINQYLQYAEVGRWRDYIFGERTYIVLSFVAKSLLAWQLYANVLIPVD